ncbi:MAG TPA: GNAT family N-acetyltransferase [Actinomycetota bacterium]|nr:GNAT family N-acetyltransferase [Actinomycetota bacterium]
MTASTVRPRPYADEDLPRLQDAVSEWIAEAGRCPYDHVGQVPRRIYGTPRREASIGERVQVWEEGDRVVGLCINLRFGVAFDVFAAPALRGTPLEREMVEETYRTMGHMIEAGEDFVLTDVFDCDDVRAALLTDMGFERFRIWDEIEERSLASPPPLADPPAGFIVRVAVPGDADQLAEARNDAFDDEGRWTGVLYRTQVMDKPGYDPMRELVAVTSDGRVAAFTQYWIDARNEIGQFSPVGTHSAFRRRGLASVLMVTAMHRMRDEGMRTATVGHDAENTPATRLYRSLGFEKRHETLGYRRPRP